MGKQRIESQIPQREKIDIKIEKEIAYILSPIPGKSRKIEVAHGCSIHLKNEKLLTPLVIAVRDVLGIVATRTRRHEDSSGTLRVLLL